jgi:hypothetical protein
VVLPQLQLVNGTDTLGRQMPVGTFNPRTGTLSRFGAQSGTGTGTGTGDSSDVGGLSQSFQKIAQMRQGGAPMDQLLQQVPIDLRDGVSAMIQGRAIPQNMSFKGPARTAAVLWSHAVDPTFDETIIPERTKFATGMAQVSPSSFGGQKILLNTALQHVGDLADVASSLGNTSGPLPTWFPGGASLAHGINSAENTSADQAAKINQLDDIAAKASGEIGKLYSGSAGGGEGEREQTQSRFAGNKTPGELAGALEATRDLISGKLNALQAQRDQVYGSTGENIFPLIDPPTKAALQKIDNAIAKLRGQPSASQPAAGPSQAVAPPAAVLVRQNGHLYQRQADGSYRAIQ